MLSGRHSREPAPAPPESFSCQQTASINLFPSLECVGGILLTPVPPLTPSVSLRGHHTLLLLHVLPRPVFVRWGPRWKEGVLHLPLLPSLIYLSQHHREALVESLLSFLLFRSVSSAQTLAWNTDILGLDFSLKTSLGPVAFGLFWVPWRFSQLLGTRENLPASLVLCLQSPGFLGPRGEWRLQFCLLPAEGNTPKPRQRVWRLKGLGWGPPGWGTPMVRGEIEAACSIGTGSEVELVENF